MLTHIFTNSGVILDIEFTQKLQNIMGKGAQTSAVNTPTGISSKNVYPTEQEQELVSSQQGVQQTSGGGNSRFSISPVSDSKPGNAPVIGGTVEKYFT